MATSEVAVGAVPERGLRAALEALPLAVVVVDAGERALYANRLAARLLGDALELGRAVPWARSQRRPGDVGVAPHGVFSSEPPAGRAAQSIVSSAGRTLRPTIVPLESGEGLALVVLTAVSGAGQPFVERKAAERLREVEAIAHLGSWTWDLEADVMTWSDEAYRLFGLAPQAVPVNYEDIRRHMHPTTAPSPSRSSSAAAGPARDLRTPGGWCWPMAAFAGMRGERRR